MLHFHQGDAQHQFADFIFKDGFLLGILQDSGNFGILRIFYGRIEPFGLYAVIGFHVIGFHPFHILVRIL